MELRIEQINVSDNTYVITALHVESGSKVKKGELVYSMESSKATMDVEAPCDGWIWFANGVEEYKEYPANFLIAQITEDNKNPFEDQKKLSTALSETKRATNQNCNEQVITQEAAEMISDLGIKKSSFKNGYITKWDVMEYVKSKDLGLKDCESATKRIAILGAGKGSMQVLDLISHINGINAVCIFDDTPEKQDHYVYGVPIIGKIDFNDIAKYYKQGIFDYIVNGIGDSIQFRKKCYDTLTELGVPYISLIHPSAVIGNNVQIGDGNIILPMVHIGPNTVIGNDNFITAQTSIEHHNTVGSHCTFGPGVKTSGSVTIGNCTRFAAGIYVENYVNIGSNCLIASGSIITNHIPDNVIVRHKCDLEIVPQKK